MIDVYIKKFNLSGPASHVTGSKPIDRVWVTNNITPHKVSIFPQKFSVGGHRVILVDLDFDQIIERGVRICTPSMRRLICENKRSVGNYNYIAWKLL